MKSRIAAKRRWFTRRNQARIAFRTRFARLGAALTEAMLAEDPARALGRAIADEVRRTLMKAMYDLIMRPIVAELLIGTTPAMPRGTVRASGTIRGADPAPLSFKSFGEEG